MKILIAHNKYRHRGGEDVVFEREAALLAEAGVDVHPYVRDSREIKDLGKKIKVAARLVYSRDEASKFAHILEIERPDLIHVHNYFPLLTPSIFAAAKAADVPVVHTLHNYRLFCANGLMLRNNANCDKCLQERTSLPSLKYGCYQNSRLRTLPVARMIQKNWLSGFLAENVNQFLCITDFAKKIFERAGIPSSQLTVKPNFSPDLGLLYSRDEHAHSIYLGRLSEEKGIRTLVEAWKGFSTPLIFVGDGPMADSGKVVSVKYTGKVLNGGWVDSNIDSTKQFQPHPMDPFEFLSGSQGAIVGMLEGVQKFKKGGKGNLYIPSSLAYGANPRPGGPVKANENLVFYIEVVDVKDLPQQP
ncbi:MAG: hypothetical protein EOO00_02675 [Chitinophagaceae bacterium]|nr:MAG: hypothetical protein EOO00_02675 [Chitinophagaceae bacterium]